MNAALPLLPPPVRRSTTPPASPCPRSAWRTSAWLVRVLCAVLCDVRCVLCCSPHSCPSPRPGAPRQRPCPYPHSAKQPAPCTALRGINVPARPIPNNNVVPITCGTAVFGVMYRFTADPYANGSALVDLLVDNAPLTPGASVSARQPVLHVLPCCATTAPPAVGASPTSPLPGPGLFVGCAPWPAACQPASSVHVTMSA